MPVMVARNAAVPVALPAVVSTKADAPIELQVAFKRKTLELPGAMRGEFWGAKKPVGNERVILPPEGIDVEGVNLRAIATPKPASLMVISNETEVTDDAHPHSVLTGTSGQSAMTAVGENR
jgi:hypothetical protein